VKDTKKDIYILDGKLCSLVLIKQAIMEVYGI